MPVLERVLTMGVTGSGKSYQWLMMARAIKSTGAIFRCLDTDNAVTYMLATQFEDLLPENGGNVIALPTFDWPDYKLGVYWLQKRDLKPEQLERLNKYARADLKVPLKPIDWTIIDMADMAWTTVQRHFVANVFEEDAGDYFLEIRRQLESKERKAKKGGSPITEGLDGWKDWCVDEETKILTKQGWKRFSQLNVGDEVMVLLPNSFKYGWEPVQDINIEESRPRQMLHLEGNSHSSLTTLGHRWLVKNCSNLGHDKATDTRWKTSASLTRYDSIPMCAQSSNPRTTPVYSNSLVEIVAWYVTEGGRIERPGRIQLSGVIYQSTKNADNVMRIRKALKTEFGVVREGIKERGMNYDIKVWYLRGNMMSILEELAPHKCPTFEFLLNLTQEQLELFIHVCLLGDGNIRSSGQKTFMQNRDDILEAFEFACIIAGKAVRTWERKTNTSMGAKGKYVHVLMKKGVKPIDAAVQGGKSKVELFDYNGVVWCPVTKSGTWLARRNGKVYFTGNSVINKLYDDWVLPIVYRIQTHVYCTTAVNSVDRGEKDAEIKMLFGNLGVRPTGQKRLGHQMHSIFLFIPGEDCWYITTAKDRSGRAYFNKVKLSSFYMQYLVAKAKFSLM